MNAALDLCDGTNATRLDVLADAALEYARACGWVPPDEYARRWAGSKEEILAVLDNAAGIIEKAGGCDTFEGGCVGLLRSLSAHEVAP